MSEKQENPYDMNNSSFDADKYLQKLLKVSAKTNGKSPQLTINNFFFLIS